MKIWISGEKLYLESKDSSLEEASGVWCLEKSKTAHCRCGAMASLYGGRGGGDISSN